MDGYYLIPVDEEEAQGYYLTPVDEEEAQGYYLIPIGSAAESKDARAWGFIGIGVMNAVNSSAQLQPNKPGSFSGYDGGKIGLSSNYKYVRLVGKSGAWNDGGGGLRQWRSFVRFATTVDSGTLGNPELSGVYTSYEWAENAWTGISIELTLGEDGLLYWGISDPVPADNYGVITFEIWAK